MKKRKKTAKKSSKQRKSNLKSRKRNKLKSQMRNQYKQENPNLKMILITVISLFILIIFKDKISNVNDILMFILGVLVGKK